MPDGAPLPVTVVDLSTGGCQIRLDRPLELPRQFHLRLDRPLELPPQFNQQIRELIYICERRWAKDLSVGVQFLDLCLRRRPPVAPGATWSAGVQSIAAGLRRRFRPITDRS